MTDTLVSVIIPTIGRPTIEQTKLAVENQTYPSIQLIVSLDKKKKGSSWARNQGFAQSTGDFIMFVDDDCVPPDNWVEKLVHGHRKYKAEVAGGTFIESDSLLQDGRNRREFPDVEMIDDVGWTGNGGNISFERHFLEKCLNHYGYLWDESLLRSQDLELALRLRNLGAKFVFIPINPIHLKTLGFVPYLHHQFKNGTGIANLALTLKKNPDLRPFQKSLIWSKEGLNHWTWMISGIIQKILGPFDVGNFSSWKNYWIFWLGSKFEALGYLWQRIRKG